ncbi:hypothetical protein KBC89_01280 [Candidatus Woesebacteria bacterium]|nr:hypothetical protein [Candidatus Woesebacteria bacterium]
MRYLIFIVIVLSSGWLKNIYSIPIDLDEIAWIHDAQVFQWRSGNNWDQFIWNQTKHSMDWTSHDFRLFDQPHFAKYIYGFALSTAKINPWNNQNRANNFQLFIQQKATGRYFLSDESSSSIFGQATVRAIMLCRWISVVFSVSALLSLFLFFTYKFSLLMSSITVLLLTTNPTIFYNLHLATSDSISLFLIVVSLILFYFLFFQDHLTEKRRFVLLFLSALSTAFAVSTKINGWLLLYIFLIGSITLSYQKQLTSWKNMIAQLCSWLFFFLGTYMYLQPELWTSSIAGLIRFFSQRLSQQDQFAQTFGALGLIEYHKWILKLSVQSHTYWIQISKGILVGITLIKSIQILVSDLSSKHFFTQRSVIYVPIWLFFFFYARIGFDRYAIWPIIILIFLSSWIVTRHNSHT